MQLGNKEQRAVASTKIPVSAMVIMTHATTALMTQVLEAAATCNIPASKSLEIDRQLEAMVLQIR